MRHLHLIVALCIAQIATAQIVTTDPPFPTANDVVTITYDATQGSGQLAGVSPVYIHTGVITDLSAPGKWRYVVGNWGVADPTLLMTDIGNNLHQLTYHIRDYYGVPESEDILELAFVFRNADGSLEGKTVDFMDIFVPVYPDTNVLNVSITNPSEQYLFVDINDVISVSGNASMNANLFLYDNDSLMYETTGKNLDFDLTVMSGGEHTIRMVADNGSATDEDSFRYIINPAVNVADVPVGALHGINELNDSTLRLVLYAPDKEFVYVIGDFNDWQIHSDYYMNRSTDGSTWWLDIGGLTPQTEYAFQYFVDGQIRIADPYSEKILDPFSDGQISNTTYPDLKPYPAGETVNAVTSVTLGEAPYDWQIDDFEKPEKTDLVIYELLMRDFLASHDFNTLRDTLDYLQELGVNAIELMPVSEFEGNIGWGYNPSFHLALDKYYGTKASFQGFIDEAHARGIAVILDVVYNHAFSQSPLCQLYWDAANFRPSPDNPWLNVEARHPFNVGYDFNHESPTTQAWVDRVMRHWIREFRVDGFRFDLSKGITQNFNTDVGAWSAYDASRIALLKRMADVCWAEDDDFYVIMEHFAANNEEQELSDYGMMLWGNMNDEYNEATMGYESDLQWVSYQNRAWNDPHLIGYMESHDEERLMYKNLQYGNSNGTYNVQNPATALARNEAAAAFFFSIPGPKMIWQFGELGYDYSINHCLNGTVNSSCRLDPKPIRWDYFEEINRHRLYDVYKALIDLKLNYETFKTTDYQLDISDYHKRIHLNHADMNALILGNFDVKSGSLIPDFQHEGWWYEYFSGDSLLVTDVATTMTLNAGEYRIFTNKKINTPDIITSTSTIENITNINLHLYPNPVTDIVRITYQLPKSVRVNIGIINTLGQRVAVLVNEMQTSGEYVLNWQTEGLTSGLYFIEIEANGIRQIKKIVVNR